MTVIMIMSDYYISIGQSYFMSSEDLQYSLRMTDIDRNVFRKLLLEFVIQVKEGRRTVGLSIYFLYNITVFANIQHNIMLQQLYNGIQEKVI